MSLSSAGATMTACITGNMRRFNIGPVAGPRGGGAPIATRTCRRGVRFLLRMVVLAVVEHGGRDGAVLAAGDGEAERVAAPRCQADHLQGRGGAGGGAQRGGSWWSRRRMAETRKEGREGRGISRIASWSTPEAAAGRGSRRDTMFEDIKEGEEESRDGIAREQAEV